jgi:hypothetical protein
MELGTRDTQCQQVACTFRSAHSKRDVDGTVKIKKGELVELNKGWKGKEGDSRTKRGS